MYDIKMMLFMTTKRKPKVIFAIRLKIVFFLQIWHIAAAINAEQLCVITIHFT